MSGQSPFLVHILSILYGLPSSLTPREFNSYGARRGNDAVMTRGTFANIKLLNKFIGKPAPKTICFPKGVTVRTQLFKQLMGSCILRMYCDNSLFLPPASLSLQMDVFDAAEFYQRENIPVIILAGKKYGQGSSRDWAAKGPFLLVCYIELYVPRHACCFGLDEY